MTTVPAHKNNNHDQALCAEQLLFGTCFETHKWVLLNSNETAMLVSAYGKVEPNKADCWTTNRGDRYVSANWDDGSLKTYAAVQVHSVTLRVFATEDKTHIVANR